MLHQQIVAGAACVAAVAALFSVILNVILVWVQIRVMQADARRVRATDMMKSFVERVDVATSLTVRDFAENLDLEQCRALWERRSFNVSSNLRDPLIDALRALGSDAQEYIATETADICIGRQEANQLRGYLLGYLNLLEMVATAWRHGVADREILVEEFKTVVHRSNGKFVLEDFRCSTGIYPSLQLFVEAIQKEIDSPE